jgi:NAD-dependent SIR2 family protein deacetylase
MIPKPLLGDIANGKCLPFIGAGFSLNALLPNGKQMPTWNQLISKLADDLQTSESNLLEVAQEYENQFGRPKLIEKISESLYINEYLPGEVHKLFTMIESFDLIYTTNFDILLEDAYKEQRKAYKSIVGPHQFAEFGGLKAVNIVKMHGDVNHSEYIIITKDDYENYLKRYDPVAIHLTSQLMTRTPS